MSAPTRRYIHDKGIIHPPAELVARSLEDAIRTYWRLLRTTRGFARAHAATGNEGRRRDYDALAREYRRTLWVLLDVRGRARAQAVTR